MVLRKECLGSVRLDEVYAKVGMLPTGTVLAARYEILDFLGSGGFAEIYVARDSLIQRQVAIKVFAPRDAASSPSTQHRLVKRFAREAHSAALINHPHAITVFDIGTLGEDGVPFIIMEWLEGHDLERELALHGVLSPERARTLLIDALDALGAGHRMGVVHRDLKPSNLFLVHPGTPREHLKVVDYGIVHLSEQSVSLTSTGGLCGTLRYMAPEYIEHQQVGPALDVYQMGLVLVELLAGVPAVQSENPIECLVKHQRGDLNIPAVLLDSVLGPVIRRATALDPGARFPDAAAMAKALRALEPVEAPTAYAIAVAIPTLLNRVNAPLSSAERSGEDLPAVSVQYPEESLADSEQTHFMLPLWSAVAASADDATDDMVEPLAGTLPHIRAMTAPYTLLMALALTVAIVAVSVVGVLIWVGLSSQQPAITPQPVTPMAAPVGAPPAQPAQVKPQSAAARQPGAPGVDAGGLTPVEADADLASNTGSTADSPGDAPPSPVLKLMSVPAQVEVWEAGVKLGETPLALGVSDGNVRRVRLVRAGFKPETVLLSTDDGAQRVVRLIPR